MRACMHDIYHEKDLSAKYERITQNKNPKGTNVHSSLEMEDQIDNLRKSDQSH